MIITKEKGGMKGLWESWVSKGAGRKSEGAKWVSEGAEWV